jgi:S1-C subfamily serine protease
MQPVRVSPSSTGLIVLSVEPNGPAQKAGLFVGDVLIAIDDAPLHDTDDLQAALAPDRIGKTVNLKIIRGGSPTTVPVTVGERP